MIAPSRTGLALLLALAVPAAFTAAWACLQYGGPVRDARDQEDNERSRSLGVAQLAWSTALLAHKQRNDIRLELDPDGSCTGPFAGRPIDASVDAEPALAEATAKSELANGRPEAAIAFLDHALGRGDLTGTGSLMLAELLRQRGDDRAEDVLATAADTHRASWCGSVPFLLLHALQRARSGDGSTANLEAFVQASLPLEAGIVATFVDEAVALQPTWREDERIGNLLAAAEARQFLRTHRPANHLSLPSGVLLFDHASPFADNPRLPLASLCAIPRATVDAALETARDDVAERFPELRLRTPSSNASSWRIERVTLAKSTLLANVASTCLGLAIATLVLGNLVLWRLSRRELALVRMRRDFVDVVSHELRTPLTALSLKAEMLANGDVPQKRQQHYLQTLNGDVHRLADQVERILDFGRLEKGAPLQRQVVPTRSVLAKGLRAGMPALRLVQQNIEVDAPRSLPPLDVDVEVLARALRNLLENAAKYAPAGSTVALRAYADGNTLSVEVADTGPGVAQDEHQAIFQPFVRASSANPGIQGSGLGLALVSAAAKAHGGTVEVRDRQGGGAVFTLQLPIAKENVS